MMKKYTFTLFAVISFYAAFSQGYQITLQAPAFKSGITYLTYYMGNNFNIADSAAMNNNGTALFKGSAKLPPGIYAVFLPGKRQRVELLIDKGQVINIKVDTSDLINKTVITGSKENILRPVPEICCLKRKATGAGKGRLHELANNRGFNSSWKKLRSAQ